MLEKLQKLLSKTLLRYLIVGVANTIVGLGTSFLLTYLGMIVELANTIGTCAGILNSYFLNKHFTFKNLGRLSFFRFAQSMGVAYVANMATLILLHRIFSINEFISLILASIIYVVVGYLGSRFFSLKK